MIDLLIEKVKERKRLTEELQEQLAKIASAIVDAIDEPRAVKVDDRAVAIRKVVSNVGYYLYLGVYEQEAERYAAITANAYPGGYYSIHWDANTRIKVAEKETFLWFAHHVKDVIDAFIEKEDREIEQIKSVLAEARDNIDKLLNTR